jgi:hypothetical protein
MEFKMVVNSCSFHVACLLCGGDFKLGCAVVEAFEDGNSVGFVCDFCLQRSKIELKQVIRCNAKRLRKRGIGILESSDWLFSQSEQDLKLPTIAEYDEFAKQEMKARYGDKCFI